MLIHYFIHRFSVLSSTALSAGLFLLCHVRYCESVIYLIKLQEKLPDIITFSFLSLLWSIYLLICTSMYFSSVYILHAGIRIPCLSIPFWYQILCLCILCFASFFQYYNTLPEYSILVLYSPLMHPFPELNSSACTSLSGIRLLCSGIPP